MSSIDTVELDSVLMDNLFSLAASNNINIDEYITLLLEEEILKDITKSYVSESSIY